MRKYLNIVAFGVIGIVLLMPVKAAATKVAFNCEKNLVGETDGTYTETCTVGLTENTAPISVFNAKIALSEGLLVKKITPATGFENLSVDKNLVLKSTTTGGASGATINLGTIVISVPANAKNCLISLQPTSITAPKIDVEITIEQEVNTGVTLPLVILGVGVVAGGVIYYISKKNKKMYKI
ncbi:MAG: hypothetical protein RSE41_10235 [Clostridia bacterium]